MLKNKLTSFIAKRVLICCIIMSIIDLIWLQYRWHILVGLLLGSAVSVFKFGSYAWIFKRIESTAAGAEQKANLSRNSMFGFLANQVVILLLLFAAYFLNPWFFAGIVAGVLLVPFVIMINSITEALKITSNNFE